MLQVKRNQEVTTLHVTFLYISNMNWTNRQRSRDVNGGQVWTIAISQRPEARLIPGEKPRLHPLPKAMLGHQCNHKKLIIFTSTGGWWLVNQLFCGWLWLTKSCWWLVIWAITKWKSPTAFASHNQLASVAWMKTPSLHPSRGGYLPS